MFLTEEENRKLTQVGSGTPGGELLRRYWHPIAGLHQLTDEDPTAYVRVLGEDLILFRDKTGNVGLLADHCSHRGASLLYGRVEERGIACAYHGWLFDTAGNCLECPAEPTGSIFHLTVKHRAYPVQKHLGLYWAYLGPDPVPPIRRLDISSYPIEHIMEMSFEANWVQVVENNMDGTHIGVLHQDTTGRNGSVRNTTRGMVDELVSLDYHEVPCGIQRRMVTADGYTEDDPLVFPNMLRRITELSIKVPIDDTHTRKFVVFVEPEKDDRRNGDDDEPVDYYVMPPEDGKSGVGRYPDVGYRMNRLRFQDIMAIETQGVLSPRHNWHPATGDRGVVLYERMLLREMDRVREGHDPVGVFRDPDYVVDTNFEFYRHAGGTTTGPQGIQVYTRPDGPGVTKERFFFEPDRAWLWETNLIPDARAAFLNPDSQKKKGGRSTHYQMSSNVLAGHISEFPSGCYHQAHYHGGGAILLNVGGGTGYTLMWPQEVGPRPYEAGHEEKVVRVDWQDGSVYSPPSGWYHQHFNAGAEPVRQLALRLGSHRHQVTFHEAISGAGTLVSIRDGGSLVTYSDEDPEISRRFREELAQSGIEYQMDRF